MPSTLGYKHGVTNTAATEYNSVRCSSVITKPRWTSKIYMNKSNEKIKCKSQIVAEAKLLPFDWNQTKLASSVVSALAARVATPPENALFRQTSSMRMRGRHVADAHAPTTWGRRACTSAEAGTNPCWCRLRSLSPRGEE